MPKRSERCLLTLVPPAQLGNTLIGDIYASMLGIRTPVVDLPIHDVSGAVQDPRRIDELVPEEAFRCRQVGMISTWEHVGRLAELQSLVSQHGLNTRSYVIMPDGEFQRLTEPGPATT